MRYLTILFILLCGTLIFVAKEAKLMKDTQELSPFLNLSRDEWKKFRKETPMTIAEEDVKELQGQIETVSAVEIEEVYLPLSRLLNLYYNANQELNTVSNRFLEKPQTKVPFVIGITGSVSVGKSTTSRVLKALLEKWEHKPNVQIVTTDGFLFPNDILEKRGLMGRKGFPESFDKAALLKFLSDLKSGKENLRIPIYSHQIYDIIPYQNQTIENTDIVILEGVNILQVDNEDRNPSPRIFISDLMDFSIYVDANPEDVKDWFVERFMLFREKAKYNDKDFYNQFSKMLDQEAMAFANNIWTTINEVNLTDHIFPFRGRANLIIVKGRDHSVKEVMLRKL